MSLATNGIRSTDITDNSMADFGMNVSYLPAQKVADNFGKITVTWGTAETHKVIFHIKSKNYSREQVGEINQFPAIMIHMPSSSIKKDGLIVTSVGTWRIFNSMKREIGEAVYYASDMVIHDAEST